MFVKLIYFKFNSKYMLARLNRHAKWRKITCGCEFTALVTKLSPKDLANKDFHPVKKWNFVVDLLVLMVRISKV